MHCVKEDDNTEWGWGEKDVHEKVFPCILLNQQQIRYIFFLQIMNLWQGSGCMQLASLIACNEHVSLWKKVRDRPSWCSESFLSYAFIMCPTFSLLCSMINMYYIHCIIPHGEGEKSKTQNSVLTDFFLLKLYRFCSTCVIP